MIVMLAAVTAHSAVVRHIEYEGQTVFGRKQLDDILGFRAGSGIPPETLRVGMGRLMGRMTAAGCFLAGLQLEYSPDSTEARVTISNGLVPVAGSVSVAGNVEFGRAYLEGLLSVRPGRRLSEAAMIDDINTIAMAYADRGYPHAKVSVGEFLLSENRIDYKYKIEEGRRITVDKIVFTGNKQTKDYAALRFTGLVPGALFSRKNVVRAQQRLLKSGLFRSVSQPVLIAGTVAGSEELLFSLDENRYNSVFGVVGYNRDENRPEGWLTGSIDLAFLNLGGGGFGAKVSWQRLRRENSRLAAEFSTPWVFSLNMGMTIAVSHRIEDSTYSQSSGRMMAIFPAGEHFKAGVGAEAMRVVPGTTGLTKRNVRYSSLWSWEADYRDGVSLSRGFMSRLEAEYGRKRYYDPAVQLTISRLKFDAGQAWGIASTQVLYLSVHGRAVISSEDPVPRSDQFSMGGAGTLRGYWEEQFTANQLAWGNLEYRYSPDRRLEVFPFFDLGYYYDPGRTQRGYRHGYGAGLRMDTSLGWISLIYGLGEGDKIGQGKVHVSLNSDF